MTTPDWSVLPFAGQDTDPDVACLRAVRYLAERGVAVRKQGSRFKAFDPATGFGLWADSFEGCVYAACLALIAASQTRRTATDHGNQNEE
jgi:hypothetical protein